MKNVIYILLVIVGTSGIVGCSRDVPIYNVEQHAMPIHARNLSTPEISRRIQCALSNRKWTCHQTTPNTLVCQVERRAHAATVQIDYNQQCFSINFVDADNLRYENGTIHPKYNKWVKLMETDILKAMRQ